MSDFRRFADGEADDPARALFRSMREDGPAPGRKGEVLAAALAAAATVSVAATATAAISAGVAASAVSAPAQVAAAVSGAAPAAIPLATATAAPAALVPLVPGVSIVKMIGAFVLGGAVTATGLVAGTQLLDPPAASTLRSVATVTAQVGAASVTAPRVVAKPSGLPPEAEQAAEVAPPLVESARVVASAAPVIVPSARVDRGDRGDRADKDVPAEAAAPAPSAAIALPPEPSLADEVSSLDAARRALSSGDGPGALRALDVFQGKFPRARLGTEALVLRVEALVASGRASEARGLGEPFLSAHPDSPFAPRVRRAIGQKTNVLTIP